MFATKESRVTWRGDRERSWESREFGWCGSGGRSFSLLETSIGVKLSRKVSSSRASLVGFVGILSARCDALLALPREEVGGLWLGGVRGR